MLVSWPEEDDTVSSIKCEWGNMPSEAKKQAKIHAHGEETMKKGHTKQQINVQVTRRR